MKAFTKSTLPWRPSPELAPDLDDLLSDEVTIAVMRADNVTPTEIRRILRRVGGASHPTTAPAKFCNIFRR